MIDRLFAFPDSTATGPLQGLPDNYQCVMLREGADSVITGPGVIVVASPEELETAVVLRRQYPAVEIVTLTDSESLPVPSDVIYAALAPSLPIPVITQALANAYVHAQLREEQERTKSHLARLTTEFQDLNAIGIRLSAERDTAVLLDLIVSKAREITYADAGSLYLIEPGDNGEPVLRFNVVQNDSIPTPFKGYGIAVSSSSIAGHVALTGQPLNLEDVYAVPPGSPFAPDRTHDRQIGYRTKSMLVVPLKTPDGRVIGVLQLINCKRDRGQRFTSRDEIEREVRGFPARFEDLACSLASQAAVAVENSRLYTELQTAMARLEASQHTTIQVERLRALGEMAGGLANDFNNTLAAILGRAQLLLTQSEDSEVQRQLRVIEQAALDGARTMRRMLEFSRSRGRRPFQPVDFNKVVNEAMELTRGQWREDARTRGIAYDVRIEKTATASVLGDRYELGEALTNVIRNALDAMPSGGRLTVRTAIDADHVVVSVIDSGCGMTEATRAKIFEPFFTTKTDKGSGLGLSVTYGIVSRHGGTVDVESSPGEGTSVTICLPAAPTAPKPGLTSSSSRILLIAEDADGDRETPHGGQLADALSAEGHHVVECADGDRGLAAFDQQGFDLVITEIDTPGASGWDVARLVKTARPETSVVLVTGWSDRVDIEAARRRGVDLVVTKPFAVDEMVAITRRALSARRPSPSR
ncbi:MAG: hypothetical protein DMD91_00225 [Candidatus Rokuibacteriota bacterium]|nr:MAG: hypothetical protein DMD91_00225 [Candidatus Rokubacteria bacterium]